MRAFILAVTGLALAVAACSSYGTSAVEVQQSPAQVASVSVSLPSPSLIAGQTQRARAVLKDATGAQLTGRPVLWYTSAATVASVSDSGEVVGVAPGAATLSAVSEGVSGQAALTVIPPSPAPVAKVVAVVNPAALVVGQTAHATASLADASGNPLTGRAITWQSDKPNVATVSASGDISAIAPGTAAISATSEGVLGSASLTVSAPAPIPVATVSVSPASSTLQIAGTVQLSATALDANGAPLSGRVFGWSSANSGIASVNSTGLVSAVSAGTTQITVSSEGKTTTAAITVNAPAPAPVATVSVSPSAPNLQVGGTVGLSAVTRDAAGNVLTGRLVTWSSADGTIASVSSSGLVTAKAAGSVSITATSEGQGGSATVTVTAPAPAPVATVSVSPSAPNLQVGGTVGLSAVTRDAAGNVLTGRLITWSSADGTIASVSSSGLVTAKAAGTVSITASSEGQAGSATVTVSAPAPAPVATVSVSPSSSSLQVGGTAQLSATTRDANNNVLTGRTITWSSSNNGVATVSTSGLVTAVTADTVTITATSETKSGTAAVTVTQPSTTGWRGNEPAGMSLISDQPFTSLPSNGWTGFFNYDIASDGTGPRSPPGAFENIYPAGWGGGGNPGLAELDFTTNYRTLYVCMYLKFSSNWQGHDSGVNKVLHLWVGGLNHLMIVGDGVGSGPLTAEIRMQGITAGGNFDGGTAGIYNSSTQFVRGQWHLVELIASGNTGSNRDGSVSLYVDGKLASSASGIEFEPGGPLFNLAKLDPTWGGIGGTVTSTMSLRVDHIFMSGK